LWLTKNVVQGARALGADESAELEALYQEDLMGEQGKSVCDSALTIRQFLAANNSEGGDLGEATDEVSTYALEVPLR
jgi:hypothetical protein